MVEITPTENKFQKRLSEISDFVLKLEIYSANSISLNFERNLKDIISIFLEKDKSKIIYILYNVGVSSQWELYNHFNVAYMKNVSDNLAWLETKNIIEELYEESVENNLIRDTWHKIYPNGKRQYKKTRLFKLADDFKPVIELFLR